MKQINFGLNFNRLKELNSGLNQSVCITEGANNGNHAVVISLLSLEPASYLVELMSSPFGDLVVSESEIESAE